MLGSNLNTTLGRTQENKFSALIESECSTTMQSEGIVVG